MFNFYATWVKIKSVLSGLRTWLSQHQTLDSSYPPFQIFLYYLSGRIRKQTKFSVIEKTNILRMYKYLFQIVKLCK